MKGIVISGTGSGVGKTVITTGLLSRLSKEMKVQAYKVGPDFIDPMYHTAATGRRSRNLDSFFMDRETIRNLVGYSSSGADICVVEGVRGLYEGLSGTTDECSTAEMAKILGFPVILIVDASSLTRSAAAIINGFKAFDRDVNIAGVILNNVSGEHHRTKLTDALKRYTDTEVIGVIERDAENAVGKRHLGLNTIREHSKGDIAPLEAMVSELDTDRIMDAAESNECGHLPSDPPYRRHDCGMKVAVPTDDAYCFYYQENLECMSAAGMDIITFSPLNGDMLPDADIYYLGGGYPELFAERISENRDFLEGLKTASDDGRMILGECGGLLTMCGSLTMNGVSARMSGIFDADAYMSGRHGPRYVIAGSTGDNPLFPGMSVRGHEFHYSSVRPNREYPYGYGLRRGDGLGGSRDGLVVNRSMGTYMHHHALSTDDWMGTVSGAVRRRVRRSGTV